jgi:hypothetical protein
MNNYWDDQEEVERRVVSSAFNNLLDSIVDMHTAVKVLAVTVTAELMAFVMIYVSKDKLQDFLNDSSSNVWIYSAVGSFLIGFLTVIAASRFFPTRIIRGLGQYMIMPIAIIAGLGNIGLFVLLVMFEFR